ncbi:YitT family protein [Peribacillus frigoritolerans]|nr:YitT family protein [Peribacillus frigoritolerans]
MIGLGIGLMLRYGTSTGGTDMLAQILSRKKWTQCRSADFFSLMGVYCFAD